MTPAARHALAAASLPLVHQVAASLKRTTMCPAELDELVGWGCLGLLDAARRFDPATKVPFGAYAQIRIRGAAIEGVRGSRSKKAPTRVDDPDCLLHVPGEDESPEEVAHRQSVVRTVRAAVAKLPGPERAMIEHGDLAGREMQQAGADLGLSKSWASRLRTRAIEMLREQLKEVVF